MANSADPDQFASSEANWSGSTLFAKAGTMVKMSFRTEEANILKNIDRFLWKSQSEHVVLNLFDQYGQ